MTNAQFQEKNDKNYSKNTKRPLHRSPTRQTFSCEASTCKFLSIVGDSDTTDRTMTPSRRFFFVWCRNLLSGRCTIGIRGITSELRSNQFRIGRIFQGRPSWRWRLLWCRSHLNFSSDVRVTVLTSFSRSDLWQNIADERVAVPLCLCWVRLFLVWIGFPIRQDVKLAFEWLLMDVFFFLWKWDSFCNCLIIFILWVSACVDTS